MEIESLLTIYRNHNPDIILKAETKLLLDHIKSKGANITLLTDGRSITQRNKIRALGLETWMDKVFISEELGSEKPSENNFMAVENHYKTLTYCYIADNLKKILLRQISVAGKPSVLLIMGLICMSIQSAMSALNTFLKGLFLISKNSLAKI